VSFKGVLLKDFIEKDDADRLKAVSDIKYPKVVSWRGLTNIMGSYAWQVKPPGVWCALIRHEDELITTSASIPINLDYEHVYGMLGASGSRLYGRVGNQGLIAFAVSKGNDIPEILAPGFKANVSSLIDITAMDMDELGRLSSEYDWPQGLLPPALIQIQSAHMLGQSEHRQDYLRKYPEGFWLCRQTTQELQVFEVIA
jgi:hypothetical protein